MQQDNKPETLNTGDAFAFEVLGGARLIKNLAWILVFAGCAIGLSQLLLQGGVKPGALLLLGLGGSSLVAIRRRRPHWAALIFCWGVFAAIYMASVLQAGLAGSAWAALSVASMLSGWLLGRRHTLALVVFNFAAMWWIYRMHATGVQFTARSLEVAAITYAITPMLGAIIGLQTGAAFRARYTESETLRKELAAANADLELRVAERSASLTQALQDVKRMQSELVEGEKLASLGALVAGVSHELNTPIGNALMVSTTLEHKSVALKNLVQSGTLKRSELTRAVQEFEDAAQLINLSLARSAELIASFKQVAVDQTSERRRHFQLADTVRDVAQTLGPTLRQKSCNLTLDIAPGIDCDSYPGPLVQVVSNLVLNAAQHAFESQSDRQITIRATTKGPDVVLEVQDNGTGMTETVLAKAFEPFFTTRLGRGGSGLGLAICHRICTNVLGGSIVVASPVGKGCVFTVAFPSVAPGKIA